MVRVAIGKLQLLTILRVYLLHNSGLQQQVLPIRAISDRRGLSVKKRFPLSGILIALLLLCSACTSTSHHFTSSAVGLGYIKTVAVIPLENFTSTKGIDERCRELLITRLLGLQLYEVVEKGELHSFLKDEVRSKEKSLIDQRTAKRLAREFNVEAYMTGSVDEYKEVRNGSYSYPVIALTLRMVDIKTGKIVWQASADDSGYSSAGRLFGLTAEGTNAVLFRLIDRLLNTMSES